MSNSDEQHKLDSGALNARLRGLPGWSFERGALRKTFEYPTFLEAIAFVNRVAALAETLDHHPDIEIHWRRVAMACWTHKLSAVTEADVKLAEGIESLR